MKLRGRANNIMIIMMASVQVIKTVREMLETSRRYRKDGKSIGFVPTMGALHEGHLSLIRRCASENDITVVSIFVNPTQFGPNEDYNRYPRDPEGDIKKAESSGANIIFMPTVEEMYPEGYSTFVEVTGDLVRGLCAPFRPGHFRGVTTVVTKLFNIVEPDRAYFGKKDYQQWRIIQRMVKDLNMPIEIIGCPTVREPDGLAMSSRNQYLKPEERDSALSLYRSLLLAKEKIKGGEHNVQKIIKDMKEFIESHPHVKKVDYIEIVEAETLRPVSELKEGQNVLIALAVHVGSARLIDNMEVKVP